MNWKRIKRLLMPPILGVDFGEFQEIKRRSEPHRIGIETLMKKHGLEPCDLGDELDVWMRKVHEAFIYFDTKVSP